MRPLAQDLLGRVGGDLFDLHAAGLRRHHDVGAAAAVERDREIQLALDRGGLLDEDLADQDALGRRLRRLQLHPEDLAGGVLGGGRIIRELDATGLAPPAGVDLSLDDDPATEVLGNVARLGRRLRHLAARHRHAEVAQERLGLVLVNLHAGCFF